MIIHDPGKRRPGSRPSHLDQTEEASRGTETRLCAALETVSIAVFNQDRDLRYTWIHSPQVALRPEDIIGKTDADLLPPEYAAQLAVLKHRVLDSGSPLREEISVHVLGKTRHYDCVVEPLCDDVGQIVGITGATWDVTESREKEQTQAQLVAMLDATPGLVGLADAHDTHILYINAAGRKMVGVQAQEDVTRLKMADVHPVWADTLLRDEIIPAATRDGIWTGEYAFLDRDGRETPVMMTLLAHKSADGEVERFSTVSIDISDRKAAEKTLRLTEFSVNRAADMISWISPEGRFLFVNDSICRRLGYTREELLGNTVREIDPVGSEPWAERWLEFKRHGPLTFESIHLTKSGEVFPVEVTTNYMTHEGQEYLVTYGRDISERKQARESLEDEVSRRRLLVQQSTDGIVVLDRDGKVYEANEAYARMLGYSMEEVSQLHIWDWDTLHTKEQLLETLEAVDESGDHFTTSHRRKDGTLREIEISTNGTTYGGEKLVFCVCRDITESRRAAEALQASEDRYHTLVNLSPDAMVVQADGKYVFANPAAARLFGADSPQELVGRDMFEFIHPDYRELIASRASQILTGAVVEPVEIKVLRLDGSPVTVEANAALMELDGHPATQVVYHDLTQRKETEKLLRLTQFSVDQAGDLVFWVSPQGALVFANETTCRILGYTSEELLGMSIYDIDPAAPRPWGEHWASLKEQGTLTFETVHRTKDGREFPVEVAASYVEYGGKEIDVAFSRDITERKKAELERLQLERQLQHSQKLESLGVLAGGIAHDFNNILTSVLGNAELALSELSPSAPARENLLEITASSRRAAALCRQMLAYSGRGHFVTEAIDLRALVEDMLGLLKATISKKALLKLDLDANLPPLRGDASQISQVVMNLVLNASEAIEEQSGVINISTGAKECSSKYLAQTYSNENLAPGLYLSLEVSDTGAGMDKVTQERIFEPFFTTKFTGRGLGLAAVLGIVRGHKGALRLESAVGKGTTFEILFPASEADAALLAGKDGAASSDWQGEGTILLADDEETIRTMGARMLASLGFKVITAADGREALERYAEHRDEITLVVLDLTMPHMDGEEAFRELRLMNPEVRVIVSSGYAESDISSRFADKGLVGFVHKPYSLAELAEQLQAAFQAIS